MNITFKEFVQTKKEKIRRITEKNVKRNEQGRVVIAKHDPWRDETEWDDYFQELLKRQ